MGNPVVNALARRIDRMFPQFFSGSAKHDHYKDFGWPATLTFQDLHRAYSRNGLANAAVNKTKLKTWQDSPEIWESDDPAESQLEADIRQRFEDVRLWQAFAEADARSMVGRYAGVILRFADDLAFDQPVTTVRGGLMGLVGVIPAWEGQLTVGEWVTDERSEDYGKPKYFQFDESQVGDIAGAKRSLRIHPDRVLIWSDDGTVNCRSALEAGFNDLIDAEKIKGAGGEGFWKTARGAPVIEAPEGLTAKDVSDAMGVAPGDLIDAINEQLNSFQQGFDKGLMLGGMTAKPMTITLPSPEHFFAAPLQSFAASFGIPVKILLGSQTGERASTEDASEWSQTNMARRVTRNIPIIRDFVNRLERASIIPKRDWHIEWSDLTEATASEKMDRARIMSEINSRVTPGDFPPFLPDEIRGAAGYDPLSETEYDGMREEALLPTPEPADDDENEE